MNPSSLNSSEPFPNRNLLAGDTMGGRERDVARLQEALFNHSRVLVHGPAGVGKTSLIMAGLIPAMDDCLQAVYYLNIRVTGDGSGGPTDWVSAHLPRLDDGTGHNDREMEGSMGIQNRVWKRPASDDGKPVHLLVIDNLEDMAGVADKNQIRAFTEWLMQTERPKRQDGKLTRLNVMAVFLCRDRFLGWLHSHRREFPVRMDASIPVLPLGKEDAIAALRKPLDERSSNQQVAQVLSYKFGETDLLERLVEHLLPQSGRSGDGGARWTRGGSSEYVGTEGVSPYVLNLVGRELWKRCQAGTVPQSNADERAWCKWVEECADVMRAFVTRAVNAAERAHLDEAGGKSGPNLESERSRKRRERKRQRWRGEFERSLRLWLEGSGWDGR